MHGVVAGSLGFLSSCVLTWGTTVSPQGVRSPLELRGAPRDSSCIASGMNRASCHVEVGTSRFLFISDIDLRVSAEFEQGSQASSCVEVRNSACLSSCSSVRPLVKLYLEPVALFVGCNCVSVTLHVVTSSSRLHSKRFPDIRTYLEWKWKSVSIRMWHDSRGFLSSFDVKPASS